MGSRSARRGGRALRPPMRSPGRPPGWRREHLRQFWDSDRSRAFERGRSHRRRPLTGGRRALVPSSWRHANHQPPSTFRPLPVLCRARRDRHPRRTRLRGARDRFPARPVAVDDLAGAPAQRSHPRRQLRASGNHGTVQRCTSSGTSVMNATSFCAFIMNAHEGWPQESGEQDISLKRHEARVTLRSNSYTT